MFYDSTPSAAQLLGLALRLDVAFLPTAIADDFAVIPLFDMFPMSIRIHGTQSPMQHDMFPMSIRIHITQYCMQGHVFIALHSQYYFPHTDDYFRPQRFPYIQTINILLCGCHLRPCTCSPTTLHVCTRYATCLSIHDIVDTVLYMSTNFITYDITCIYSSQLTTHNSQLAAY